MITHGLRTLLLAQGGITALVPAQTVDRVSFSGVFCGNAVQGFTPPYVRILDPARRLATLDGTFVVTIDVEAFSKDEEAARTLGATIKAYLEPYKGAAGASDTILMSLWEGESYRYDFPDFGADIRYHIVGHRFTTYFTTP